MSSVTLPITRSIPRDSKVIVVLKTGKHTSEDIYRGMASGSCTIDLDPGHYFYKVRKVDENPKNKRVFYMTGEFYHEVDEKSYRRLRGLSPKACSLRMTSHGREYSCGLVSCIFLTSSRFAMLLHEANHQGIDLMEEIKKPDEFDEIELDVQLEALAQQTRDEQENAPTRKPHKAGCQCAVHRKRK